MNADIESAIIDLSPQIARDIKAAAERANNEAEFRGPVARVIEDYARSIDLQLHPREEYTLINGRADAVYNRFIIEYEPPGSLRKSNSYRHNQHAIGQVKGYIEDLHRMERHRIERIAGAVIDGSWFIFVRRKEERWNVDDPVPVTPQSIERFLRYLNSLSTELALTPENLVRDFGENTVVSRLCVNTLYNALSSTDNSKVQTLFKQWSVQFSEICGYDETSSRLDVASFGRSFGVGDSAIDAFRLFFSIHTYYATFIKLLAVQIASFYAFPKLGTGLQRVASYPSDKLLSYLRRMERGGVFKDFGINNFLEGDFFTWYMDVWNEGIEKALRRIISELSNYSLVTLDVDPEATRDLLKKLYQHLMPKQLRHDLGEYYTPDWLAERLLNQLEGGRFKGDPDKRILDPACGSGTFLVLAIRKIREYCSDQMIPEHRALEKILVNIVGFDLNPLAVISARTNYLLALGDLLQHRKGEIDIPIYLADSILTPYEQRDLVEGHARSLKTVVGTFAVPESLVSAQYIDTLANLLEESVEVKLTVKEFRQRLLQTFPLDESVDIRDISIVERLFSRLGELADKGVNGIWARIIKNAFAPLFQGEFDYIVGNPPWVNWESLPDQYRDDTKPLWEKYGLFSLSGWRARMGGGKKDISVLMTYAVMDNYLRSGGRLGFVVTQTIFKTKGAGEGFRRFQLGKSEGLRVLHVDDMVAVKPFEGASNRTSVIIIEKGQFTRYPVQYTYWRKKLKGDRVPEEASLSEVISEHTRTSHWNAEPIDEQNVASPWITGRPRALRSVKHAIGKSAYSAHAGSCTWANGIYWVEILARRPDGLVVINNEADIGKKNIENVQVAIEPDLLYPLLRGQDVGRWKTEPSLFIIMAQDPEKRKGWDESWMRTNLPKTYNYLKHFEKQLRGRSGFRKYFDTSADPFYSMYNVGEYTFSPYKVVWREVSNDIQAAVAGINESQCKVLIPDHTLVGISVGSAEEAHYICAILNSSPANFIVKGYVALHPSPHIMEYIAVPQFEAANSLHIDLSKGSQRAHKAAGSNDETAVAEIEERIDGLAAELWGLSESELRDIKDSLADLAE